MGTHTHGRRRTPWRVLKSLVVNGRTIAHGASGPDTTHECPRVGSDIWHTQNVRFEWFTTMLGAAIHPSIVEEENAWGASLRHVAVAVVRACA